ncbi:hypothetical protein FQA47_018014 [Oryzias melastigma]|uniref:Uncharacterized protein n=1 Tax=Oryzias melastigma TaxID=30732 RepID=A0A834F0Y5_ORYME|nr:hypothetical protein FQA47_018014 [Oryzias melastigma]
MSQLDNLSGGKPDCISAICPISQTSLIRHPLFPTNHAPPLGYKSSRTPPCRHDRAMAFLWILSCLAFIGAAHGETQAAVLGVSAR